MSSGRSGASGGRSGPEPAFEPSPEQPPDFWDEPPPAPGAAPRLTPRASGDARDQISDLPALPFDSMPPMGRMPFDASERGRFWPGAAPQPGQGAFHPAPRVVPPFDPAKEQISGAAAAQLFGATAHQPPLAPFEALNALSQQTSARISAAPFPGAIPPLSPDPLAQSAVRSTEQTLTQQMRAMQPPDVARQAINELNVLAEELITLARELEQSGLARMHRAAYFEIVGRYGELARQAWLSIAAERLEQDGASQEYRQRVIGIARDITRLQRESDVAASNEQFPLPRRRPYLWRRRARIIARGLRTWQAALVAPVDPQRMGLALFELRGALNTASVASTEFSLLGLLTGTALWLTPLSGLAAGLVSLANALTRQPLAAASFALVTLLTFMLWTIMLLLTSRGRATLAETLAGISFSPTRSACNGRAGSRFIGVAMRLWWLLIGWVGVLLTLAALVGSGLALARLPQLAPLIHSLPRTPIAGLLQAGGLLALIAAPAATVATAALVALAAPALLVSALRLAGEMAGARRWVPTARRYALTPALATLAYLTGALVALAWLLASRLGLAQAALATVTLGHFHLVMSERAPLLALALALPYLALIEAPFRLGLGAWRRAWLRDLRARRTTIEAHVRRLSAPDPRTGAPDTGDETLRAMQYDLVLLQFYTARIAEAERASAAPLSLGGALALLIIFVVGALLLDGGAHALAQALVVRLIP